MNDKQAQRLEKLLEAFVDGVVTPEQLKEAIDALIDLVHKTEVRLGRAIEYRDRTREASKASLTADLTRYKKEAENALEKLRTAVDEKSVSVANQVREEMKRVGLSLADFEVRLGSVDERFAGLPPQQTGEDVRNALEALPEGDKLAIEAIEGLQKQLDALKKQVSSGGGGTQGGITAAHPPIHETFTMNGADFEITLSQGVGAQGRAVFACRYQNGMLDMDKDYSINGNKLTLNFVPEADTTISITYLS